MEKEGTCSVVLGERCKQGLTIEYETASRPPSPHQQRLPGGKHLSGGICLTANIPWLLLTIVVMLCNVRETDCQGEAPTFKPVWQWRDPGFRQFGFFWPEHRKPGENKACTCAHLDYSRHPKTGEPLMACVDNDAEGRRKTFYCGDGNHRGRAGHDEFQVGMRPSGPCTCETTPGKMANDACMSFKTEVDLVIYHHPMLCLPVVDVNEDTWENIPISTLHDQSIDGPNPFILPPRDYPDSTGWSNETVNTYPAGFPARLMKLTIDVQWGMLDIFNEESKALNSPDAECQFLCQGGDPKTDGLPCLGIDDMTTCKGGGVCLYKECNICCEETDHDKAMREREGAKHVCGEGAKETKRRCRYPILIQGRPLASPKQIKLQYRNGQVGKHRLTVVGNWKSLMATMLNLKYKGLPQSTTTRLRSPTLSRSSAIEQPYETVFYEIRQRQTNPRVVNGQVIEGQKEHFEVFAGNLTVLIRITASNDPPTVYNPQSGYQEPSICSNLANPAACCNMQGERSCCQCFFGQFYSFEDTSEILGIPGMTVDDVDIDELTEAARFNVRLLVKHGNVNFNARTGLEFYDEAARDRRGFMGNKQFTNNAIRLLKYRVETPELVNREESTVLNYNTQQDGNSEYFDISFSDQGYTSATGKAASITARVHITIVALNDPPTIKSQRPDFDATEDLLTDITGIEASDIDLMETITSPLAKVLWMNDAENRQYTKTMAAEVSVQYGHMYLGVWSKLNVIRDAVTEYISLAPFFATHDLCQVLDIYAAPPGSSHTFEDVCTHINAGTTDCATGDIRDKLQNPNCRCGIINRCGSDKYIVLYLNRSKVFSPYRAALKSILISNDKTCGGLPFGPLPNNYTFGKACSSSMDCTADRLPRCGSPERPCFCCANISVACSSDDECTGFEKDSFCGCRTDTQGHGVCGPYFSSSGQPVLFDKKILGYPREPNGHPTATSSQLEIPRFGTACTYVGEPSESIPTDVCLPAVFIKSGSQAEAVLSPLTVDGVGSPSIKFFGARDDVNRALAGLSYKTVPYFNRLYRPPLSERPPGFDPSKDTVDALTVVADDLGNSGGMERQVQTTEATFQIRTTAINNAPSFAGPERLEGFEDLSMPVALDQQDEGTRIVSAGWHNIQPEGGGAYIYVWDLRSAAPILNFKAHDDVINQVVLTKDDSRIISCSGTFEPEADFKPDYTVRVFETSSGLELLRLPRPSLKKNQGHLLGVKSVAVNDDSTMLISGGYDMAVCLWDMQTGKMLNRIGGLLDVETVNGTAREMSKKGHRKTVSGVTFYNIPDEEELQLSRAISLSDDTSIRLYDLTTAFGTEIQCIGPLSAGCDVPSFIGHTGAITSFAIMNNAGYRILATASEDALVIVWKLGRMELTKWQTFGKDIFRDHVVAVSLMSGAKLLGHVPRPLLVAAAGHRSEYSRKRFKPVADTTVRLFDLETQEVFSTIVTKLVHFSGTPINTVAMTPDSKRIVTSNDDGKVGVIDITTGTTVGQMPCPCLCPAVLVQDPWSRCQEPPCKAGCVRSSEWPEQVVSSFALFNNPIKIKDPDSKNYGFEHLTFRFEAYCSHGKMHLIESLLKPETRCTNDRSLCKGNRDCLSEDGNNGLCKMDPARIQVYENEEKSTKTIPWPPRQGIHRRPLAEFGKGNTILAIKGTMSNINQVLAGLVYIGDSNFNTRYGVSERIYLYVNDQGALADNYIQSNLNNQLSGSFEMSVLIESVNDPPKIGSQALVGTEVTNPETGVNVMVYLPQLVPINDSNVAKCMSLPPSSQAYLAECSTQRPHIDVDEDTIFTITPDLLWVDDVDSKEAIDMKTNDVNQGARQYLCSDPVRLDMCTCRRACFCEGAMCRCPEATACDEELLVPGELLVEIRVGRGKLTIRPPPGRSMVPTRFLRNVSNDFSSVHECLLDYASGPMPAKGIISRCYETCPNQLACSVNATFLVFQTTNENLQKILGEKYLTYVGNDNIYGADELQVWVADQGFTDGWYNLEKSYRQAADKKIKIRLIGVNDAPVVEGPDYVIYYQMNTICHYDWSRTENKNGSLCPYDVSVLDENLRVPPMKPGSTAMLQALEFEELNGRMPFIRVSDVDLNDNPYGNLTLNIEIGLKSGYFGFFTIKQILPMVGYFQFYRSETRTQTLQMKGTVKDINLLMEQLYFSSETSRMGYAPFIVKASDNNNYGECSGVHFCGNEKPCDDARKGEPHEKSLPAIGKKQIDVIIGNKAQCQYDNCKDCNNAPGCGWCPSYCEGVPKAKAGKCMIGDASPRYDLCPKSTSGLSFKQCEKQTLPIALYAAVGAVGMALLLFLVYRLIAFARRRHGNVLKYVTKQASSITRSLRRLHLMPPLEANYTQLFVMITFVNVIFVIFAILQPGIGPDCKFSSEIFIDSAVVLRLVSDKCTVRFLPASKSLWPSERDYGITSLKFKIAIQTHLDIKLETDLCFAEKVIRIQNNLPLDVRYKTYFCNVAILVPENLILPNTVIEDFRGFSTQVRSGSMDKDSRDFAIDFGPNSFTLLGSVINARMRGVKARSFKYKAESGSLFMEELTTGLDGAEISSDSADLIVTTPSRTSLRFWQHETSNKVCLTAAKGSLYVDGNCQEVCAFLPPAPPSDSEVVFEVPTTKEGCQLETVGGEWNTTHCNLICQSLKRPLVPGCYNLDACMNLETKQCLCKPTCDLVPAAKLEFGGFSGVPGTCNDAGQCCRSICAGYSRADLHPEEGMPRDASDRKEDPYAANKLDQQWTLESQTGQISFKVGSFELDDTVLEHSYQGSAPKDYITPNVAVPTADKDTLELLFHPGGDDSPKEELFETIIKGPGTPEEASGQFLWLRSEIYLILPKWMLEVLSFGLLSPQKLKSRAGLNPGFCPVQTREGSPEFIKRSVFMYKALLETFENWPKGQTPKLIPYGSMLVYKPAAAGNQSLIFTVEPKTGEILVDQFDARKYPITSLMLIFGWLVPMLISTAITLIIVGNYRRFLFNYRRVQLTTQAVMSKGLQSQKLLEKKIHEARDQVTKVRAELQQCKQAGLDKMQEEKLRQKLEFYLSQKVQLEIDRDTDKEDAEEVSEEAIQNMVMQTNFFYMAETLLADPEEARPLQLQITVTVQHVCIGYFPTVLPLYVLSLYNQAFLAEQCEFRPDRCSCLAQESIIGVTVAVLVSIHWIIVAVELGFYYLQLKYNWLRRLVRLCFYVSMGLFLWLSISLISLLSAWTFLGLTINPLKAGPYVIAAFGVSLYMIFTFVKKMTFRQRVEKSLLKSVQHPKVSENLAKDLPRALLDMLMAKNIERALHSQGFTAPSIFLASALAGAQLILVFLFLFIGFAAFSDPKDPTAGMLNSALTFMLAIVALQVGRAEDVEEVLEDVARLEDVVLMDIQDTLAILSRQVEQANFLIDKMQAMQCSDESSSMGSVSSGSFSSDKDSSDED